jgi:hypothetical protein
MLQQIVHYGLHFLAPGLIAWIFFRKNWKQAWLIMLATMLVDFDHLLATPMFLASRCSIGFHPLHSYYAIGIFFGLLLLKKTRILGIGLVFHIVADTIDCLWM